MANDLSLRPAMPLAPPPSSAGASRPAPASDTAPVIPASAVPNPRLRIDGELGMVVIEFRDSAGEVAETYPGPREIKAYRDQAMGLRPTPGAEDPEEPAEPERPASDRLI